MIQALQIVTKHEHIHHIWSNFVKETQSKYPHLCLQIRLMDIKFKECLQEPWVDAYLLKKLSFYYIETMVNTESVHIYQEFKSAIDLLEFLGNTHLISDVSLLRTDFITVLKLYAAYPRYVVRSFETLRIQIDSQWSLLLLFDHLFIPYEAPEVLVVNLFSFTPIQQQFVLDVLQNKDVRQHKALMLPCTKKEIHLLKNISKTLVCQWGQINFDKLLFTVKCLSSCLSHRLVTLLVQKISFQNINRIAFQEWLSVVQFFKNSLFEEQEEYDAIEFIDYFHHQIQRGEVFTCPKKSLPNIKRDIDRWHRELFLQRSPRQAKLKWLKKDIVRKIQVDSYEYTLIRFSDGYGLQEEGQMLGHCVLSYANQCAKHYVQIWSIRGTRLGFHFTAEIRQNRLVQLRGKHNRHPTPSERTILKKIVAEMKWEDGVFE